MTRFIQKLLLSLCCLQWWMASTFTSTTTSTSTTTTTSTSTVWLAEAIPMQVTVNQRQSECLYDRLKKGERVTGSVFILSGSSLKATLTMEGPLMSYDIDDGMELQKAAQSFSGSGQGFLNYNGVVDFEHLISEPEEEEEPDEPLDEGDPIDPNDPDAAKKRRERRERQRQKFLDAKAKRDQQKYEQQRKLRQDGDPFVSSHSAPDDGWYRMCVTATWYQVTAEMELRKESELGGIDDEGHVLSYEEYMVKEEDKELEQDTASEEGIKEEDFQQTRDKIRDLRRLLNEIQSMQQKERRRLSVHAETNEHSHSRMVLSSLFETLLFMAITGYQVYTIRKWFSGAPVLGR
eukprot:Nitzschia sp. Nitz4//scaffold254_size28068//7259//8587//NITZ4_008149-RA/size28068-augustus-gene-0.29-mRNA-1//1//CDS//3329544325//3799//frame0